MTGLMGWVMGMQEKARRALAKRNSGQKLSRCLAWLLSSLDRALEQLDQLELRGQARARGLLGLVSTQGVSGLERALEQLDQLKLRGRVHARVSLG